MNADDDFYIGWQPKAPARIGRGIIASVVLLLCFSVGFAVLFGSAQQTIGVSVFEWGRVKDFQGVFLSSPHPLLLVQRPGTMDTTESYSSYYLVRPFKFGLDAETARSFDGQQVILRGTLIYREGQTMLEVSDNTIRLSTNQTASHLDPTNRTISLGVQTLRGEIVDSKCYFGVMNPGQLIPHRACAIRCISGGIPPVFLVRQKNGPPLHLLLVSKVGLPVNRQILDLVAEPVEITGEVERQGDLFILRADPNTYRRI
jgi:hypothetical protein